MPWTASDAKKHKKGLTSEQAKKWASTANAALKSCQAKNGKDCEGYAIRVANSKFSEDDFVFGVKEDRKKPGGSNAGKYKSGPFCGPSGGAPKGTYPVNTKARAKAAIAYARHAPNPSGIKACVYRHWPSLKPKSKEKQKMSEEKLPKGALRFVETGAECQAFAKTEEGGVPKMSMRAYSGGVIKGHWYWGNLAIDLEGMSFPKSKYPILEDHITSKKIAFTGKPIVDGGLKIDPDKTTFVDTPESKEFQRLSAEGFPYQSSIYAKPSSIERVEDGAFAEVNGFKLKGPATIWRKSEFREASVCVFGWDSQTSSAAFSREETEDVNIEWLNEGGDDLEEINDMNNETQNGEEVKLMDLKELKEKYPDLAAQLTEEVTQAVTDKLAADHKKEKETLQATIDEKDQKLSDQGERLLKLEKAETIRQENELKYAADKIWNDKLSDSNVSERLYDKCKKMVSYTKFVKDGAFDQEAFAKAVDDEISDWESKGAVEVVQGSGFSEKKDADNGKDKDKLAKEEEDLVKDLAGLAGVEAA